MATNAADAMTIEANSDPIRRVNLTSIDPRIRDS
jgi:hypothetical protein